MKFIIKKLKEIKGHLHEDDGLTRTIWQLVQDALDRAEELQSEQEDLALMAIQRQLLENQEERLQKQIGKKTVRK